MFESGFIRKKAQSSPKLNLVALMDIFTILVFFLLLNAGEAERLENAKFVKLPDSHAGTAPHGDLVVMIGEDAIWIDDAMIISREDLASSEEADIPALREALAGYRERKGDLTSYEEENGLALTIMGDHAVPYGTLKNVMSMARIEQFRDISLAVNQVAGGISMPAENPDLAANFESSQLPISRSGEE